jgi:hypothetical protein
MSGREFARRRPVVPNGSLAARELQEPRLRRRYLSFRRLRQGATVGDVRLDFGYQLASGFVDL